MIIIKPYVIKERCAAQPSICPPIKACPKEAVVYLEDENEPIGGRIEFDYDKCDGCGACVEICCGSCIEMRGE